MILRVPKYYKLFNCIAGKCNHSCCSNGWEIDVDDNTYDYYKKSTSSTSIMDKISSSKPHHILNNGGDCPFLNEHKLCNIYINLGEEHMCKICQEHPRFYEWFDNFKEGGIGLCCEEAARIILTDNAVFETYDIEVADDGCASVDGALYKYINECRNKLFSLFDSEFDLNKKIRTSIVFACDVQQNLFTNNFVVPDFEDAEGTEKVSFDAIFEYLLSLEIFNSTWVDTLKAVSTLTTDTLKITNIKSADIELYLNNIAKYFIWRYFIKAVFDKDVYSKIVLMVVSVLAIKLLYTDFYEKNKTISTIDCIDIVRRFSEEIEYCEKNIELIYSDSYNNSLFSAENLLNYFS